MSKKKSIKIILPFLVIVVASAVAVLMIKFKPVAQKTIPEVNPPLVRIQTAMAEDLTMMVVSQGSVSPRTQSQLVAQVGGQIIEISPQFMVGGFFEKDEILVKLDSFDYQQQIVAARAELARAELRLAMEEAEAVVAADEWEALGEGKEADPLTLRLPQLTDARASRDAALARVEKAERDLQRTVIRAPYDGRLRNKMVDLGQVVTPGAPLATLYSVDYAEIRLPLANRDLAYLNLPLARNDPSDKPQVLVHAEFAGTTYSWEGQVVRTEGEIDRQTRMVHAIARVKDPYAASKTRPPLAVGMFVEVEIQGRAVGQVYQIDRSALHPGDRVRVVDADGKLRTKDVDVYRVTDKKAILSGGLDEGDRVILTPLEAVTEGMSVRIIEKSSNVELATGERDQ